MSEFMDRLQTGRQEKARDEREALKLGQVEERLRQEHSQLTDMIQKAHRKALQVRHVATLFETMNRLQPFVLLSSLPDSVGDEGN